MMDNAQSSAYPKVTSLFPEASGGMKRNGGSLVTANRKLYLM